MGEQKIYNRRGIETTPIMFALIPLALLGGFLFLSPLHRAQISNDKPIAIDQPSQNNPSFDSDADGLKDWEEQIYGTDPHNADTDGDKTHDGDEIAQGRDPLKPNTSKDPNNPNDRITQKTASDTPIDQNPDNHPNLTQKVTEIFGRDYLLKLIQNPNAPQNLDAIADKMVQAALDVPNIRMPSIAMKDIIVSHNTNQAAIRQYFTQVNDLVLRFFPQEEKSPLLIFKEALEQKNLSSLNVLDQRIQSYGAFLEAIKKVLVPDGVVLAHLKYVNAAIKEQGAVAHMRDAEKDILLGLVGMREFNDSAIEFSDSQKQYADIYASVYFNKK